MNHRLVTYSLAAGSALLLALPAVAYSQFGAPRAPRFAGAAQQGEAASPPAELRSPRGPQRFGNVQRGRPGAPPQGVGPVGGRRFAPPVGRRAFDRQGGIGGPGRFGRQGGGDRTAGLRAAGILDRGGRSGLAARALARAEQIGLAAEQRDRILAAQRSSREASIERRAATELLELDLRDLLGADAPDVAAIEARLRELAEHRIAGQIDALRLDQAVREVLSAEQLDELAQTARRPGGIRSGRGMRRGAR